MKIGHYTAIGAIIFLLGIICGADKKEDNVGAATVLGVLVLVTGLIIASFE